MPKKTQEHYKKRFKKFITGWKNQKWTTKISKNLFNIYPMYDWKTSDIWVFAGKNKHLPHNHITIK